jgi:hypothetical protein
VGVVEKEDGRSAKVTEKRGKPRPPTPTQAAANCDKAIAQPTTRNTNVWTIIFSQRGVDKTSIGFFLSSYRIACHPHAYQVFSAPILVLFFFSLRFR